MLRRVSVTKETNVYLKFHLQMTSPTLSRYLFFCQKGSMLLISKLKKNYTFKMDYKI